MEKTRGNEANVVNGFDFGALPITVVFVGRITDEEWPHDLWSVCVTYKGGNFRTPFKTGIGLKGKKPTNVDIMYSLLCDTSIGEQSFNAFCSDFGHDNDSIKAFSIYQECCNIGENIHIAFTRAQIEEMRKALEDY